MYYLCLKKTPEIVTKSHNSRKRGWGNSYRSITVKSQQSGHKCFALYKAHVNVDTCIW